jgi:hypothetical protein
MNSVILKAGNWRRNHQEMSDSNCQLTLTPSLSHPMGEGALFSVSRQLVNRCLPDTRSKNPGAAIAVPLSRRTEEGSGVRERP